MTKENIIIEDIPIVLERKNIKNMYLRVLPPSGEVKISAPMHISDKAIADFVVSRKDWILEKQKLILSGEIKPEAKYRTGEKHFLWGEEYTLQLILNDKLKNAVADDEKRIIYLPVSKRSKIKTRQKLLYEFYRAEVKKELDNVFEKCVGIVGERPSEVKIRNMKNWGNCRYQDKRITLNLKLAMKNKICLEYVLIHELTHLIEFNHGKNFKKLMDEFMPNWREIKKKLNKKEGLIV